MNAPSGAQNPAAQAAASVLRQVLARRCERNPKYSLRALAKSLGVSHAMLSLVLTGKRGASRRLLSRLLELSDLKVAERRALMGAQQPTGSREEALDEVTLDHLALSSEWQHAAILALLQVPGSRFQAKWISRALGITEIQARIAMDRLHRAGLVSKTYGRWRRAAITAGLGNELPETTASFHAGVLERAATALGSRAAAPQRFTSDFIAVDPAQLPALLEKIEAFRRQLLREFDGKGKPGRVVALGLHLFPVE